MDLSTLPDFSKEILLEEPLEKAFTIPSSWYTRPAFHDLDQEAVFQTHWHLLGHTSQLTETGAYLSGEVAGNPALVIKTAKGLKAFYNVCRHRGGPLVTRPCGVVRMLQCQYHGWTYKLDGTLRGVPRFDRVDLFDRRDFGLVPLEVDTWQGLVFARKGESSLPLETRFSGISQRIHPIDLSTLQHGRREVYDIQCNWKVYVDNYLEGYHLPYVHPELCDMIDVGMYQSEVYPTYSLQFSRLSGQSNGYGASSDTPEGTAYYYYVFPNLALNIMPERLQTNIIQPMGPDSCRVIFDYFYPEVSSTAAQNRIEKDVEASDRIQQEDIEICLHVQKGLRSEAYDRGRFSVECEAGVHHFHSLLKKAYATYVSSQAT